MKKRYSRILLYVAAVLSTLWIVLPYYWTFTTSLLSFADIDSAATIPRRPHFENYLSVLFGIPTTEVATKAGGVGGAGNIAVGTIVMPILNSMIVALGVVGYTLLVATPAAYAYSRFTFRGKAYSFVAMLTPRIIPIIVVALPFFILFNSLRLIDTPLGLMLAHIVLVLPFGIWVLRDFFDAVPKEFEEAALVDGATRLQTIYMVLLPVVRHGLIAVAILAFMTSWGEFFLALTLTDRLTVPPTLTTFRDPMAFQYGELAAGVILAALPPVALAYAFQKYLIRGVVGGAIKR